MLSALAVSTEVSPGVALSDWKLDSEVRLESELWKVPSAPDRLPKAVTSPSTLALLLS